MEYHPLHGQLSVHQILSRVSVQILRSPSLHSSFFQCSAPEIPAASVALSSKCLSLSSTLQDRGCLIGSSFQHDYAAIASRQRVPGIMVLTSFVDLSGVTELHHRIQHPKTVIPYIFSGFMIVCNGRIKALQLHHHGQKLESLLCYFILSFCCQIYNSTFFLNVFRVLFLALSLFDSLSEMSS